MGSEGKNNIDDGTTFQSSEPTPCANGCGFFGTAATRNLCSKCYRYRFKEEQAASAIAAVGKLVSQNHTQTAVDGFSLQSQVAKLSSSEAGIESAVKLSSTTFEPAEQKAANRCLSCRKKVGLLGFKCRCGSTYCGTHRYPEKHECPFDFKTAGREAIAKSNPVVKADKIERL